MKAIVIGASIAGLAAAQVLAKHCSEVTVVEPDRLPLDAQTRPGTPQDKLLNFLLKGGEKVLEELFPGLIDEMLETGAIKADVGKDYVWSAQSDWRPRISLGFQVFQQTRPHLEYLMRRCVMRDDSITFLEGSRVIDYLISPDGGEIEGVTIRSRDQKETYDLAADLVVDASGRGSRTPKLLEKLGYGTVPSVNNGVEVGYACRIFKLKTEISFDWLGMVIAPTGPQRPTGAALLPVENGQWLVNLSGYAGNYPGPEEADFMRFIEEINCPSAMKSTMIETLSHMEPVSRISRFLFAGSLWRMYEKMPRFPAGLFIMGDAYCSPNPALGQGMTVALLEASAFDKVLTRCTPEAKELLTQEYFSAATRIIETPWRLVCQGDEPYLEQPMEKTVQEGFLSWYYDEIRMAAAGDTDVMRKYLRVAQLLDDESGLMDPEIISSVIKRNLTSFLSSSSP